MSWRKKIGLYSARFAFFPSTWYVLDMQQTSFVVYIEQDEDGVFIGSIPSLPGCHAQGDTEEEMLKNLHEALTLCLRNTDQQGLEKTKFVGIHNLVLNA